MKKMARLIPDADGFVRNQGEPAPKVVAVPENPEHNHTEGWTDEPAVLWDDEIPW